MKTYHGAELFAEWTKRGGTQEGWVSVVAPLMKPGTGPLFTLTQETFENIMGQAK